MFKPMKPEIAARKAAEHKIERKQRVLDLIEEYEIKYREEPDRVFAEEFYLGMLKRLKSQL
ncbi:hypothetical protein LCGC14_2565660 [marine sediment metagenome]|uniref:Uncharacterized protein n=1 Tax=marine sediment metagenome TaxID=412755 RepID=A0A0F9DBM9_9ZZZZ